jgi:hypothetical protein
MRIRTILAAAAAPAALAAILLGTAGTTAASAATTTTAAPATLTAAITKAPAPFIASTYEPGLPDTTTVPTGVNSDQGPVWAYDNMTRVITAKANADGTWTVTFAEGGSYNAIANPLTGDAWEHTGLFGGHISYIVSSTGTPKAANLHHTEPASATHGSIMGQLFNAPVTVTGGGHYSYSYYGIPGAPHGVMTQVG